MSEAATFRRAIPLLPQPDVGVAVAFYRDRLGFQAAFQYEGYAGVERGAVRIHFWKSSDRDLARNTGCRIEVTGIDALHAEYQASGVVHPKGQLEAKPWGFREFTALDEAGNALVFAEPIA